MKEAKISGLKSHYCHVILQHLLLVALCGLLTSSVQEVTIKSSMFFAILGTKELRMTELEKIKAQIPTILCKLKKEFPPAFFDVMLHLPIHLADEAKIVEPVKFSHMYSIE